MLGMGVVVLQGWGLFMISAELLPVDGPKPGGAWTMHRKIVTSGPWTGEMQMFDKPVTPLHVGNRQYTRFDVVVYEKLAYRGLFPPTLLKWPDIVAWPKGQGGASQGPPIRPEKFRLGVFLYANYSTQDPKEIISARQLQRAFDTARFDIVWRGFAAFAPSQLWGIGPMHTRVLASKS